MPFRKAPVSLTLQPRPDGCLVGRARHDLGHHVPELNRRCHRSRLDRLHLADTLTVRTQFRLLCGARVCGAKSHGCSCGNSTKAHDVRYARSRSNSDAHRSVAKGQEQTLDALVWRDGCALPQWLSRSRRRGALSHAEALATGERLHPEINPHPKLTQRRLTSKKSRIEAGTSSYST